MNEKGLNQNKAICVDWILKYYYITSKTTKSLQMLPVNKIILYAQRI